MSRLQNQSGKVLVFSKYITLRNGKRKYHPTGGVYVFWAKDKNQAA